MIASIHLGGVLVNYYTNVSLRHVNRKFQPLKVFKRVVCYKEHSDLPLLFFALSSNHTVSVQIPPGPWPLVSRNFPQWSGMMRIGSPDVVAWMA